MDKKSVPTDGKVQPMFSLSKSTVRSKLVCKVCKEKIQGGLRLHKKGEDVVYHLPKCAQIEAKELLTTLGSASDRNWKKLQGYDKLKQPDKESVQVAISGLMAQKSKDTTSKPKSTRLTKPGVVTSGASIRLGDDEFKVNDNAKVKDKILDLVDKFNALALELVQVGKECQVFVVPE